MYSTPQFTLHTSHTSHFTPFTPYTSHFTFHTSHFSLHISHFRRHISRQSHTCTCATNMDSRGREQARPEGDGRCSWAVGYRLRPCQSTRRSCGADARCSLGAAGAAVAQRQAGAELRTDHGLKAPSIFITHSSGDIIVIGF
jgi:hypothetical protein